MNHGIVFSFLLLVYLFLGVIYSAGLTVASVAGFLSLILLTSPVLFMIVAGQNEGVKK